MKTSARGVNLIKAHESLRLNAYPDPAKGWAVPTIGYGHTAAAGPPVVYKGLKITAAEADAILYRDLDKFERYVTSLIHVPLNQNQFDALVSFTFNLGPGNLEGSTLRKKLNAGDYAGAAEQFHVWRMGDGKVMGGLVKRRAAEAALFLEPVSARPPSKPAIPKPTIPSFKAPEDDNGIASNATITILAAIVAVAVLLIMVFK